MPDESEADVVFVRSTFCSSGNCIEVGRLEKGDLLRVRSSQRAAAIEVSAEEWMAFVEGVKAKEFGSDSRPLTSSRSIPACGQCLDDRCQALPCDAPARHPK